MKNMDELHHELMISQKNGELTPEAKKLLVNHSDKEFEKWYDRSGKYSKIGKEKLKEGGMEHVFKYWKNFNGEKQKDPKPYFTEVLKRGLASTYYKSTGEYREKKLLDGLRTMGLRILRFNLPHEIEQEGAIITKFHYEERKDINE